MNTGTMAVVGSFGTISRGKSARTVEIQEVREYLMDFIGRSDRSPNAHIKSIHASELHRSEMIDMATQLTEHYNQSAIGKILENNIFLAKQIISLIDQGWKGDCTRCGEPIPAKRICCALSTLCIVCASKLQKKG